MGTSLMLKMTAEQALRSLGVEATVQCTDLSTARGMSPDVVLGQPMHTGELAGLAPVILPVADFLDADALVRQLEPELVARGWLP